MSDDTIARSLLQIQAELASVHANGARRHAHMIDDFAASEKIRECYQHAEVCEREAAAQSDPALRKDFLDTAARWVKLAQSYEIGLRLKTSPPRSAPLGS
jgi:hypothetical protein